MAFNLQDLGGAEEHGGRDGRETTDPGENGGELTGKAATANAE